MKEKVFFLLPCYVSLSEFVFLSVRWHIHRLPVYEAVQQLFAGAVLRHQHQVARRDVGFVQSHDLFIVEGFQDLILLQDFLLVLLAVGNDLCHVDFARHVLSALSDDTKTTPEKKNHKLLQ